MYEQLSIFDLTLPEFRIDKPIRLIELFAGIGSQAMALRDLGADFEHYRMVEYDKFAVASYNAIHGTGFSAADIRDLDGRALGICDTDRFCYIMTHSFPCQDLSLAGQQKGMKKRQRHKVRAAVGSRTAAAGVRQTSASAPDGKCAAGPCKSKYAGLSGMDRFSRKQRL